MGSPTVRNAPRTRKRNRKAAAASGGITAKVQAASREKLRQDGRAYATAALQLDDKKFAAVGVKLKGAAGSFREIDDRPLLHGQQRQCRG